jgi:hypothetical protein
MVPSGTALDPREVDFTLRDIEIATMAGWPPGVTGREPGRTLLWAEYQGATALVEVRVHAEVPPDTRVFTPDVAFPGGTIVGRVVSPTGQPVTNATVKVTSITGRVVDTRTDEKGTFTAPVPQDVPPQQAEGSSEILRVAVGAAEGVVTRLLQPGTGAQEIPREPPRYLQPESKIHVRGEYPEVALEDPDVLERGGEPTEDVGRVGEVEPEEYVQPDATPAEILAETGRVGLPTAYAVGPGGQPVVTAFEVPRGIEPGAHVLALEDTAGRVHRSEAGIYTVQAGIDQETLGTGEKAQFFFDFDFGPGPQRTVSLEVTAGGAIAYEGSGMPQELEIDESGHARFTDTAQALQGTPLGAPFTINATIQDPRERAAELD